jgi:quinol monooxygenase YgiN
MSNIHVIITFDARPDCAGQLAALLAQARQGLPDVPGCRAARLFTAIDGHTFTMVEDWDSSAAHQAHLERVVSSGGWDTLAALLAQPPVSRYYTEERAEQRGT